MRAIAILLLVVCPMNVAYASLRIIDLHPIDNVTGGTIEFTSDKSDITSPFGPFNVWRPGRELTDWAVELDALILTPENSTLDYVGRLRNHDLKFFVEWDNIYETVPYLAFHHNASDASARWTAVGNAMPQYIGTRRVRAVPEPATLLPVAASMLGCLTLKRRARR